MSDRYKGAILSPTAPTVTPQSAGGIYTSSQQLQYQGQGVWPTAFNNPINNSLRFRNSASAYLSRTPGSSGNTQIFTFSAWVKLGQLSMSGGNYLFSAVSSGSTDAIRFTSGNTLQFFLGGAGTAQLVSTAVYRDPAAWYHVVVAVDTTQSTASNRVRMYVNGVEITSFSTANYPAQNTNCAAFNVAGKLHTIGNDAQLANYGDEYLTEVNFVNAVQLTPSSFGTTDAYGIWQPIPYTGTYGTNGFYLPFTDNSALTTSSNVGLGKDFSGNANYWVTNNISITAGSTYDSMVDVPTNTNQNTANYATLNPLIKAYNTVTYSNGNLQGVSAADWCAMVATVNVTSGKWYWECTTSNTDTYFGIQSQPQNYAAQNPQTATGTIVYYASSGEKRIDGNLTAYGASYTSGDTIGVALDIDGGTVTFYKNNSSQGSINLSASSRMVGQVIAPVFFGYSNTVIANFGQRPFAYTPPTGFYPLNTYNLPTPTILAGDDYFNPVLYTGNGGSQSVTGVGFQPDWVWVKVRSSTQNHSSNDSVRGAGNYLVQNATAAERFQGEFDSFDSDGFSLTYNAAEGDYNVSGGTYVAWNWKANQGTNVSNTQGTITSTVSANTTAGFSILTYTGNNTSGATVGHGLGVKPSFIIVKKRTGTDGWGIYHTSLGATKTMELNTSGAESTSAIPWNNTEPTSSVIYLNGNNYVNSSSFTYVMYCFAAVSGYSAMGSYTGNGSNLFVYTGFRPRFVLFKKSSSTGYWVIFDTARNTYNVMASQLWPNDSAAENSSNNTVDFVSNGFTLRGTDAGYNDSGATYIYMAFAENPFKIARAR